MKQKNWMIKENTIMDSKNTSPEPVQPKPDDGGKIAIVTGGGSGLGLAIAKEFTQNGIQTIIVGRDEEKLKTAKEQLGENCFYKICDLTNLTTIPQLIENILTEFGQID